jgi:glucarate dehydratase
VTRIKTLRVTAIAFKDPPLLNSTGVHQPWALRAIIELETDDGRIGLGETYGDQPTLENLERARSAIEGLDPFETNTLLRRIRQVISVGSNAGLALAPGTHGARAVMITFGALEVACLDLQGQILGRPICDLLGGRLRDEVPYSAYLFYKFRQHQEHPGYDPDPWGEVLSPETAVREARTMIQEFGFGSIKLKGGALPVEVEVETMRQLRAAFPQHPLRIDPNAAWTVETSIKVGRALEGTLEYLEDPTPGLQGMGEVARQVSMPLATNMVVTGFEHFRESVRLGSVGVVLSDHHYWGGLRATQHLATLCSSFGIGLSMHSNSHLGISLMAMTHVAASVPTLSYALDTHYPWQDEEVIEGGRIRFEAGTVRVPTTPGLGVKLDHDALEKLHRQYLACGITQRDDISEMQKYDPNWTGQLPRY